MRIFTYWCRTCGRGRNFGDQLGPLLLARYGYAPRWAPLPRARLVTVGSVLSKVPDGWTGAILGTGFIAAGIRRRIPDATVHAVRGALTRDACGLPRSTLLGDPGILVGDLVADLRLTGESAAVVPHYVDADIVARHPDARRISILSGPGPFLAAIARSSVVYTSSLHALITADALGVPQILELHPRVKGGLHKFTDYASAFGDRIVPGVPHLTDRAAMAGRQAQLREAYLALGT